MLTILTPKPLTYRLRIFAETGLLKSEKSRKSQNLEKIPHEWSYLLHPDFSGHAHQKGRALGNFALLVDTYPVLHDHLSL